MSSIPIQLSERVEQAIDKQHSHNSFRPAMNFLMGKRLAQFPDTDQLQQLRDRAAGIRANAISKLPELLQTLEQNLVANNIQVHWAKDSVEANQIITQILKQADAKTVVKGKSMVSEEIELNQHLEREGIQTLETDLGEYIIQLAGETPSHIVMPAIHKSRQEIAQLLHQQFPEFEYTEDVDQLTAQARAILRTHFQQADAGISGGNFAVAETGTLCLIENEGNGRMCTTVPDLHIAVTGVEKVVEKLSDVPPLLEMLTKSATGQPITTYVNMISSPRKPGEKDGPSAVHLVLLDNGRSEISVNEQTLDVLKCIRCGSCINHCPVYVQLGGHAYGTTYPGPIGIALEPMKQGVEQLGDLTELCTLCGACAQVCPVKIPLPSLINQLRADVAQSNQGTTGMQARLWQAWRWLYANPTRYRLFTKLLTKFRWFTPGVMPRWSRYRQLQKPADKPLSTLAKEAGFTHE